MGNSPKLMRAACGLVVILLILLFVEFTAVWQELSTVRSEIHRAKEYQLEKRQEFWIGNEKIFQFKSPIHAVVWQIRN